MEKATLSDAQHCPGCHSQGDTIEEALDNIKEAIVGCLESLNEERAKAFGSQATVMEVTV